ncbi:MAG: DUF721 domain-containing protein [Campylobacteraceae bacterium]|jgi:hypothetical protein|nr:DUF721 domain-containing protein [Campylobacteraceae bacterium]
MNGLLISIPGGDKWLMTQELAKFTLRLDLHRLFRYAKVKGNTLVFVFSHPAGVQEFNLSKPYILDKMRVFYKDKLETFKILDIKFTQIHSIVIIPHGTNQGTLKQNLDYTEKATGNFRINCANPTLKKNFEDIQEAIKKRRHEKTRQ